MVSISAPTRTIFLGVALAMAANALHLLASYLVKIKPITAADNLIFRASTQTVGFGVWTLVELIRNRSRRAYREGDVMQPDGKSWFSAVICNFAMSTTILLQFVAVKMLPLSDFITFQFTAPVFAMIATTCVMRSRVPLIAFIFICVIFFGDCLVAQPSFFFGSTSVNSSVYEQTYTMGTVLTLVVAIGSGCYRVLQATSSQVPTCDFMFLGGLTSLAVGFLCPIMKLESRLFDWYYLADNFWMLLAISVSSLMSALLLLVAVKTTGNPVLVSVVRTVEILMSLLLDTIRSEVDSSSWKFWIKVLGACIVMSQIICISFIDKIQASLDGCRGRPVRGEYEPISDDCNNLSHKNTDGKIITSPTHSKATRDEALILDP